MPGATHSRRTPPAARRWLLPLAALAALALAPAGASAAQVRSVGGPGAVDSGDCLVTPCATIARAVAEASPGDTVEIAAGDYDEQLTIDKPLTLQGEPRGGTRLGPAAGEGVFAGSVVKLAAGASGTVLRDLEVRSRAQYEAAITTSGGPLDGVTLEGVTVRGIGPSTPPTTVAPGLEISVAASGWKILDSSFESNYQGILVSGDASAMTIEGSRFVRNREGLDVLRSTPLGPGSTGTIDGLVLRDSAFVENEYRGLYFEGLSDARIEAVTVTGTGKGKLPLPTGAVGLAVNLKAGDYGDVSISDSRFDGSVNEGVRLQVRGSASDSAAYQAAPATLESFSLTRSTLSGNGGPGIAIENEANLEAATIAASRIVANGTDTSGADAPVSGIFAWNEASGTSIVAAGNWFGCNAGPAAPQAGCDTANAPVAAAPWLVLTATASASALAPGASAVVRAALATDSAGMPARPAPDGTPVAFAAAGGTVAPAAATLVAGAAGATFTAGAPGEAAVAVTVDGQRVAVPLSVQAPPPERERVPPAEEKRSAPAPQPPAPDLAPPAPASIATSGGGGARLVAPGGGPVTVATVTCAADSCRVEARRPTLKVGGRAFAVRVRIPRRVAGGNSVPVRVVLPRKARQALERGGSGRLRIRVTVTGADGTARTVTVKVLLRAKRSHRGDGHR